MCAAAGLTPRRVLRLRRVLADAVAAGADRDAACTLAECAAVVDDLLLSREGHTLSAAERASVPARGRSERSSD